MYKAPQQRSQSRIPFTSPKTSSNQHTTGSFRVQPQLETSQPETQKYSSELADAIAAKVTSTPSAATQTPVIQTKLTIGAPGDKYEQEADSMAQKVMSMSDHVVQRHLAERQILQEMQQPRPISQLAADNRSLISRHPEESVQQQMQRSIIQRAGDNRPPASSNIENQLQSSQGGGNPLAPQIRAYMESRFGADFSSVRVHTGEQAVQMNRELGAQAFTHGNHIYYGAGKSPGVNELTAHELTHVVQQTGNVTYRKLDTPITQASSVQMRVIQRQDETSKNKTSTPPGRGLCTEFGNYWIVPDNTKIRYPNLEGEQITEAEFAKLQKTWNALESGSGKVQISETDANGQQHDGFKDKILSNLGKLLSKPTGRKLITGLVNGSQIVTIQPSASPIPAGGKITSLGLNAITQADGKPGSGSGSIIELDPNISDNTVRVFNRKGQEIADPIFIMLGHELIHAKRYGAGLVPASYDASGRFIGIAPPSDPAYGNREEEETISTGSLTENDLRNEHNLEARYGHGAKDNRFR